MNQEAFHVVNFPFSKLFYRLEFGVNQQGGPTLLLDGFMYQVARVRAPASQSS